MSAFLDLSTDFQRRVLACCLVLSAPALAQPPATLRLISTVPMPNVDGRIDHMALDVAGQRLFVAALGNNTLEVIDVRNAKHVRAHCDAQCHAQRWHVSFAADYEIRYRLLVPVGRLDLFALSGVLKRGP